MKPLMPSPRKPRTTLPTPTNLNGLLTIIWTFVLITPNLTSAFVLPPPCASTCYLNAFDSEASLCDALNTSCLCDILESAGYLTCIEDDCDTASLQQAEEYGEQYCGAGYSTLLAGAAAPTTTSTAQDVIGGAATPTAATSFATAINSPAEPTATAEAPSTSSAAAAVATNTDDNFDIPTNTLATVAQSPTITPFAPTPTTVIIQQDSSSGGSGGLSRRKRAGIGAGAGVGGAALLCIVGALAWKLGQRRKNEEEEKRVAAGRAMAAATAAGGAGANSGNNGNSNNGGGVSGGVNYVPSGEEAAWTKIEVNATETELGTGHDEGGNLHVQDTML